MSQLHTFLTDSYQPFLTDLAALVNVDCGTHNKAGVDTIATWIANRCTEWGAQVERLPLPNNGDCIVAHWKGTGQGRVMLMGHMDTVYPDGTVAVRPMWFEDGKVMGPGTCDMKSGLLVGLYAVRALLATGFNAFEEIAFFFNSDEEIGSPASRALYGPVAKTMDAALVLEAARANGDIVSARKGSGEYTLTVRGKAAHAGVEPHKGANAVLELAHQIIALRQLDGLAPGVTVNPDVIGGGTKSNVIAEEAWVVADVRAVDVPGAALIRQKLENWPSTTTVPGTQVSVTGRFGFSPMAKTPAIGLLANLAKQAATELGFTVNDVATGGASDANTLAGFGVPVLDGLGPIGGSDHSPQEYIDAASITPRTELVAILLTKILAHREQLVGLRN